MYICEFLENLMLFEHVSIRKILSLKKIKFLYISTGIEWKIFEEKNREFQLVQNFQFDSYRRFFMT